MNKKVFSIIPLLVLLTACGYDLKELYPGDAYNNPVFEENYYRIYSEQIDKNNPNNTLIGDPVVYNPTNYLRTYDELEKSGLDPYVFNDGNKKGFSYILNDKKDPNQVADFSNPELKDTASSFGYGPSYKMNRTDDIFSYGYLSKLYDGQLFCGGLYQLSRVQIDESGFGVIYNKEMVSNSKYVAFNFKGILFKEETQIGSHYSDIDLTISLYSRSGSNFKEHQFNFSLDGVPTNVENYTLLTIPLEEYNLSRIAGYSISYKLKNDDFYAAASDKEGFLHSLMLYEVLFPNSSWR